MIVTRSSFAKVLEDLKGKEYLSIDTETTGLRLWHNDRIFSVIIAHESESYYFNFIPYPGQAPELILHKDHLNAISDLGKDPGKTWFIHNAKFDMAALYQEGIEILGKVHCTKAIGLVEYNEHDRYDLASSLFRIGLKKDDTVERYIEEHKLYDKVQIPGKRKKVTRKHFDQVPFDIILPYGCKDADGTYRLGKFQIKIIQKTDEATPLGPGRSLQAVYENEQRLTHTVFRMEKTGIFLDKGYALKAAQFETERVKKASEEYLRVTGRIFKASAKDFAALFVSEKGKWEYTEKDNPSFGSEVLKKFDHPAAKLILEIRDAKSKADFYHGFIYHADPRGRVHPNFNPDGAGHGRFSSSEPNFQNLTREEDESDSPQEFIVRRAIIPTPGYRLVSIDFKAMEYCFMLELACELQGSETPLVKLVKEGLDVHEATAQLGSQYGVKITRDQAKTSNFLTLYGGGNQKLADGIKCSLQQAKEIREAIFRGAPEIKAYIQYIMGIAERRGFIINWLGRRCHFPNQAYAYCAPNYHVSGGCADIIKIAMNRIDDLLHGKKTRMIMTVHDELIFENFHGEEDLVGEIKEIMERVYPSKYLPLTCSVSASERSLGDLV